MELFAERSYYFCRYCGTFEFLEAAGDDGVRVVERPAAARACPICAAPLAMALLDRVIRVEHCEACRGLLIACQDFAQAVSTRRAREAGPGTTPRPLDAGELKRHVKCPSCHAPMDVHPYYGPGNIVIDTCARCNMVWLDSGELKRVTEAPGRDRGNTWRTD
jgi:Zn-finger nucleic acid-binding protein